MFQITVLSLLLFLGGYLLNVPVKQPDERWNYENGLHYTMIFNTFVFMQVFNEINSRKIHDEFNVFDRFFNNPMFLFVIVVTIVVQIALVEFGGEAVKCSPLTAKQHLICIAIGSVSLIVGFLVKLLPISLFTFFKVNEEPLRSIQERDLAYKRSLRKSRSIYKGSSHHKLEQSKGYPSE